MSTFPGSPRTLQGAIVGLDPFNPLASIVVFQYNPERLQRSIQPATPAGATGAGAAGGARAEALRLRGAPVETITVEVEIDATDQLAKRRPPGLHPGHLPPSSPPWRCCSTPRARWSSPTPPCSWRGTIEIIPPVAPLTLFVWGPKRVLPVRLTKFSITEEAYDLPEPDPRQGLAGPAGAHLQRPPGDPPRLLALPGPPGREGGGLASIGAVAGGLSGSTAAVPGAGMGTIGGGASFRVGG